MVGADFPVLLPARVAPPLRRPTSDGSSYSTGWTRVTVSYIGSSGIRVREATLLVEFRCGLVTLIRR